MAKKPKSTDIPANSNTTAVLEGNGADSGTFSGQLEKPGDHDWVKVELEAGKTYHFYLSFQDTGSATNGDSELFLFDALGTQVGTDDSSGVGANSFLAFPVVTDGTYFIDIGEVDNNNTGDYSLFVTSILTPRHPLTSAIDNFEGIANETIIGGRGADTITIGAGSQAIGEQGNDVIVGNANPNRISGGLGNDTIDAGAGVDALFGDAGNDNMFGGSDPDSIYGGIGDDFIDGGTGADNIYGGAGKDFLTGGLDDDKFFFTALTDSRKGVLRDVILDFASGDSIRLDDIDAKRGGADNAFHFIGKQHFHHKAGELHYLNKGAFLLVEGDVNGDGKADFQIEVHGVATLAAGDFSL